MADHLLIPGVDWRDKYGLNEFLVRGTFGRGIEGGFVDRLEWERLQMSGKRWFVFDRGKRYGPFRAISRPSEIIRNLQDELGN
jgi:hypothetical protein